MSTFKETAFSNIMERTADRDGNALQPHVEYGDGLNDCCELVWTPANFVSFGKLMRTTNRDLSLAIKNYYAQTFHDIRGVYIAWDGVNFSVDMYFSKNMEPKPADKIDNLIDITAAPKSGASLYALKQAVDNKTAGKRYTLNDQTKLLLSDVCFGGKNNAKPQNIKFWQSRIREVWIPATDTFYNPRAGQLILSVTGCFDLHRILSKMFGRRMVVETLLAKEENSNNTKVQNRTSDAAYEARYIRPVVNEPYTFIMNIEQFDKSAVERITTAENPIKPLVHSGLFYFS